MEMDHRGDTAVLGVGNGNGWIKGKDVVRGEVVLPRYVGGSALHRLNRWPRDGGRGLGGAEGEDPRRWKVPVEFLQP